MEDNKKVLESIDGRLKTLECRISTVESGHTNLKTEVNRVEAEVTGVKSEIDELKKHLCVVSEEARFFRDSTSNLTNRLMSLEYRSNDSNLIVWNVPCESQNEAKVIFEKICEDGLQMSEVPEFSIVIVEKEKIFFKVNVRSTDAKVDILKRGKRLKGKLVANHINIHLSDDAPISIRVARKKLFAMKDKLTALGISSWVSNSIPTVIRIERANGVKAVYQCDQLIPELSQLMCLRRCSRMKL